MAQEKNLLASLLDRLHTILVGGNAQVPGSKQNFVTWCSPGIPFHEDDFQFSKAGIMGALDADQMKAFLQQAYNFSVLVDFIPGLDAVYDESSQEYIFNTDGRRLSALYGDVLKYSKVVDSDLTPEQEEKIKRFRDLMFVTKEETNLVTNEVTEVVEDGPVMQIYKKLESEYDDARQEYVTKMAQAAAATGPEGRGIVLDWTMNEQSYFKKVMRADEQWVSKGYKNEVDEMNAYITQVTQRSLLLWKRQLIEFYEKGKRSSADGLDFFYTLPIPGNFIESSGWTEFSFSSTESSSFDQTKTKSWNSGIEFSGLIKKISPFGADGTVKRDKTEITNNFDTSEFSISFEFTQIILSRSWFYPSYFSNRGWTLGEEWNMQYDDIPSDGNIPPKGNFIAYPMKALMIRNLTIKSKDFSKNIRELKTKLDVEAKGSIGWGPFKIKAKGGTNNSLEEKSEDIEEIEGGIKVPGMQIIGFVNNLIPKAPNPLEDLDESQFV